MESLKFYKDSEFNQCNRQIRATDLVIKLLPLSWAQNCRLRRQNVENLTCESDTYDVLFAEKMTSV